MSAITFGQLLTKDDLQRGLKELEYRSVIRLGDMMAVSLAVTAMLVRLL